jgi:hypothetical protein
MIKVAEAEDHNWSRVRAPSSRIGALARRCEEACHSRPSSQPTTLADLLSSIPDPRHRLSGLGEDRSS